jgi:hypothetical protein
MKVRLVKGTKYQLVGLGTLSSFKTERGGAEFSAYIYDVIKFKTYEHKRRHSRINPLRNWRLHNITGGWTNHTQIWILETHQPLPTSRHPRIASDRV